MKTLVPFEGTLPFQLAGEALITEGQIRLQYQLSDSRPLIGLSSLAQRWNSNDVPRMHDLWKTTCFEAFFAPVGGEKYYEFNFALTPAWNVYEFTSYRNPQPPTLSVDFELKSMEWSPDHALFTIVIQNKSLYSQFNISLTAVAELQDHSKHYLAITHAEAKPDFHSAKSFTLLRGNQS